MNATATATAPAKRERIPKPTPESVWINKKNIQKYLPPERVRRVLTEGVTLTLAGNVPRITPTRSRWDHLANQQWSKYSEWVEEKAIAHCKKFGLADKLVSKSGDTGASVTLHGGHGESCAVNVNCGDLLGSRLALPRKWRFNKESSALVPALRAELDAFVFEEIGKLEFSEAGRERRKSHATIYALRKLLGFHDGNSTTEQHGRQYRNPFKKGDSSSYEGTSAKAHREYQSHRHGRSGRLIELKCIGNNAKGFSVDIRFRFPLEEGHYRGENANRLIKLLETIDGFVGRGRKELSYDAE